MYNLICDTKMQVSCIFSFSKHPSNLNSDMLTITRGRDTGQKVISTKEKDTKIVYLHYTNLRIFT